MNKDNYIKHSQFREIFPVVGVWEKWYKEFILERMFSNDIPDYLNNSKMVFDWNVIYYSLYNKYYDWNCVNNDEKTKHLLANALIQLMPNLYLKSLSLDKTFLSQLTAEKEQLLDIILTKKNIKPEENFIESSDQYSSTPSSSNQQLKYGKDLENQRDYQKSRTIDKTITERRHKNILERYNRLVQLSSSNVLSMFVNSIEISSLFRYISKEDERYLNIYSKPETRDVYDKITFYNLESINKWINGNEYNCDNNYDTIVISFVYNNEKQYFKSIGKWNILKTNNGSNWEKLPSFIMNSGIVLKPITSSRDKIYVYINKSSRINGASYLWSDIKNTFKIEIFKYLDTHIANENVDREILKDISKEVVIENKDILRGEKGEKGDKPSKQEIKPIVKEVVVENKDILKGDKGDPGKDGKDGAPGEKGDKGDKPSKQEIKPIVKEVVVENKDILKGDKGDPGKDGKDGAPGEKGDKGDRPSKQEIKPIVKEVVVENKDILKGDKGDPGKDGKDGAPGEKGDKGDPGKDGKDGAPGEKGDKGDPGKDGKDGAPGEKGDKGDPGKDGKDGAPGEKGDKGDPGKDGKDGAPGEKGDKGDPGKDGKDGAPGEKGDKGDPGKDGIDGAPGEKGDKGDPGKDGKDGAPGEKGDKGDPGKDGKDGAPGEKGDKGDPGKDGKDGDSVFEKWAGSWHKKDDGYQFGMSQYKISELGDPYSDDDAVNKRYVDSKIGIFNLKRDEIGIKIWKKTDEFNINMNGIRILNLPEPYYSNEVATQSYVKKQTSVYIKKSYDLDNINMVKQLVEWVDDGNDVNGILSGWFPRSGIRNIITNSHPNTNIHSSIKNGEILLETYGISRNREEVKIYIYINKDTYITRKVELLLKNWDGTISTYEPPIKYANITLLIYNSNIPTLLYNEKEKIKKYIK